MDERHGTCQHTRRAQQRYQVGAWWEQGRVADVDYQGPQLVEAQFSKLVGLHRIEPIPAAGRGGVILETGANDDQHIQVDPFDIGKRHATHGHVLQLVLLKRVSGIEGGKFYERPVAMIGLWQ
jgi:hypothetical protein